LFVNGGKSKAMPWWNDDQEYMNSRNPISVTSSGWTTSWKRRNTIGNVGLLIE
jgi:hypothetical protein